MLYEICNGGRFISRGVGGHPIRVIDSDELICVLRGELSMFEGETDFHLSAGDWLILRRGRRHGGRALYPANLSFFWLHFRDLDGWLDDFPQSGRAENTADLAGYAQNFLNEQSRIKPDRKILDLLFQLIFCELRRQGMSSSRETPLAEAAKEYLGLHYTEQVSLHSAALALHCNHEYLGRIYRLSFGMSFAEALNRRRIEAAARLLADGSLSIKDTMHQCGFNDPAYFRRKFRCCYGQSPGEFRRRYSGGHKNTF